MLNSDFLSGAVAQLGERLHGMQEVVSSNLIGSIVVSCSNHIAYDFAWFINRKNKLKPLISKAAGFLYLCQ